MQVLERALLLSLMSVPVGAVAGELEFSGFATFAGGMTLDDGETFAGYDDTFSFSNNSLVAIQASSDMGNGWGVTTQLLAKSNEDWDLSAEWAFVSYDANDNWRVMFGRQKVPLFVYSDYQDVSYAYHFISPPSGVYSTPWDVIDGIGSIYTFSTGEFDSTLHVTFGRNQDEIAQLPEATEINFNDNLTAAYTINRDWLTLRASVSVTEATIALPFLDPFLDAWGSLDAPLNRLVDDLEIREDTFFYTAVGARIDHSDYLVVAEYAKTDLGDNFSQDYQSYYVSLAKRFDDLQVHFTYNNIEQEADSMPDYAPFPGQCVDPASYECLWANTAGFLLAVAEDSDTYTVGLRWEVNDSVAFKAEYSDTKSTGLFGESEAELLQFALTTVF